MKIELPTQEQMEFYSQFKSYKLVNKDKYNEYINIQTSDIQSVIELTELQRKYIQIAERSVEKGCMVEFTFEQYKTMLLKPCVYCGETSQTIDRINSKGCYSLNNIQQTCIKCNFMKYTLSDSMFREHVKKIHLHLLTFKPV